MALRTKKANALSAARILTGGCGTFLLIFLLPCFSETERGTILAPFSEVYESPSLPGSLRLFDQLLLNLFCLCATE